MEASNDWKWCDQGHSLGPELIQIHIVRECIFISDVCEHVSVIPGVIEPWSSTFTRNLSHFNIKTDMEESNGEKMQ